MFMARCQKRGRSLNQLPPSGGDVSCESPGRFILSGGCNSYFGMLLQFRTLTPVVKQDGSDKRTVPLPRRDSQGCKNRSITERGDLYPVRKCWVAPQLIVMPV